MATGFIPCIKVSIERFGSVKEWPFTKPFSVFLNQNPDCWSVSKNKLLSGLSQYRNCYFSKTAYSIAFIKVSMENVSPLLEKSIQRSLILFLAPEYWQSESSQKRFEHWFISKLKIFFPITTDFISSIKSPMEVFYINCYYHREYYPSWSLHQISGCPRISDKTLSYDLFW